MSNKSFIQRLNWKEAQPLVKKIEPELASIIDEMNIEESYSLFLITYRYGDKFYSEGTFYVPNAERELVTLDNTDIPQSIRDALNYSALPLGMLINEYGAEAYSALEDKIFSLAFFSQGLHVGVWENFAPVIRTNITAGARSLNILPRITETNSHKKLKRYGVQAPPPKHAFEQWQIFKEASRHPNFSQPWECTTLFFSEQWINKINNDEKWIKLQNYLLKRAWKHTEHLRNRMHLRTIWESFTLFLSNNKIKPQPYIVETLQHLVSIAIGSLPGFRPATNNQAGPVDGIIRMYLEDYDLKHYYPSIMQPSFFSLNANEPNNYIYYSLQVPTYLESIPKTRTPVSARADLSELIYLTNQFINEITENAYLQIGAQHIYDLLIKIKFDYFHDDAEPRIGIRSSAELAIDDPRFDYLPPDLQNKGEARKFCERASFARGCVRISKKDA